MKKSDRIMAGFILLLQVAITFAFYRAKPEWTFLLKKYNNMLPDSINIPDAVNDLFFTGIIIVFTFIFPFAVYFRQPMTAIDILFALTFSAGFLGTRAVFLQNKKDRIKHLPFLTLAGLFYVVCSHPVPNPTASALILLCMFCFEMAVSIGLQIYKAVKS